ncbi:hypothetical protein C0J52_25395 [Blattella germanica]|nr:hypothetical protein C0J52_25395 [Blattella germanica]
MKRKEEKLKRKLITIAKCKGFTYTKEDLEKFRVNRDVPSIPPIAPTPIPTNSQAPINENIDEKSSISEETSSRKEETVPEARQPKVTPIIFLLLFRHTYVHTHLAEQP